MASTIKLKNSTTAGNSPTSLETGEVAINVADGNLFYGSASAVLQNFVVDELQVKGNLTAQQYIVSSSVTYTTQSFSSGSTLFGDTQDDTHLFTGSISVTGSVTATSFVGDGSGLTNLPSQTDENFTTADHSKLDGIEASADVTDATNVQAAGALMDSEVTSLSLIKGITAAQISGAFDAASASLASDIPTNNNELTNGAGYTTNTGTVDTSGTPSNNQVAVFTDADTIEGSNKLKFDSSILDIASTNSDNQTVRIYGGVYGAVTPYISPMTVSTLKFGDGTSGHNFDMQNNKLAFDADSTNTYIYADTSTPENLEIHADGNIELRADDDLQVFSDVDISGNITASGDISASVVEAGFYSVEGNTVAQISAGTIAFGFQNNTPISIGKSGNPTTLHGNITASGDISASGDIFCNNITIADDITSVGDDIILKDNLAVSSSGGSIQFRGTAGGSNESITYLDSGGTGRFAMLFPGSDVVAITNRASNGTVEIRANSSTAGSGGEVTVAEFQDDLINLNVAQRRLLEVTSTTDGDGNGDYIKLGSTATTAGKIYYYNSSGNWVLTDADAASSSTGLIAVAMANNSSKGMLLKGCITLATDPGTVGDVLYLQTDTAGNTGDATSTAPSGTGDVVRVIGYCLNSTNGQIYFDPSKDHIVHA
jgi:hypothetical protein